MSDAAAQTNTPSTPAPAPAQDAGTRDDVIRAALQAAEGAPPAPAVAPPAPAPVAPPTPDATQQATEHANRLAADRKSRERERLLKEREAKIAQAEEAQRLLLENPVEFAKRFGGDKFGQRYVTAVASDGKPDPMDAVKRLEGELAAEREAREATERERMVGEWRGGARQHAVTNEKLALRGFYTDTEIEEAAMEYAGRDYVSQDEEARKLLNPSETLGKMNEELVSRLTRLAKTSAGQQLLRSLMQEPTPAPPVQEQRPESAAAAPRTLTSSLDATPSPSRKQGGPIVPPSSNEELIRDALKSWQ